jgi:hypothetical protein
MMTATAPRLDRGTSATRETKKLPARQVNAESACARPAGGAPSPKTVSGRSHTATNSRPIRTAAAAAAAASAR